MNKKKILIYLFFILLILSLIFILSFAFLQKREFKIKNYENQINFNKLILEEKKKREKKHWEEYYYQILELKEKGCEEISFLDNLKCSLILNSDDTKNNNLNNFEKKNNQNNNEWDKIAECGKIKKPRFDYSCSKWKSIHQKVPKIIRAIYYSASAASQNTKIDHLIKVIKNTEVNSVVIDVKEIDGKVSFKMNNQNFGVLKPVSNNVLNNIEEIIKKLHKNNIYVIGRIVVFKDQRMSKIRDDLTLKNKLTGKTWRDRRGKKYIDPSKKEFWEYIVNISKEMYQKGFDEINFDYIRYPTDGKISQINYTLSTKKYQNNRVIVLDNFFNYISSELKKEFPEIQLSGDLFGQTALTHSDEKLGQLLDDAVLYFDRVAPMTYPSHYHPNVFGLRYADAAPYIVLNKTAQRISERLVELNKKIEISQKEHKKIQLRKNITASLDIDKIKKIKKDKIAFWLQAFTCTWCSRYVPYGKNEVQAQISGIEKEGYHHWLMWNSTSRYGNWFK